MYVSVEDIKRQINVQWDEDDALIESMIRAAELSIEKTIGTPLSGLEKEGELPADLIHAIRLMVANFYEHREGMTYGRVQQVPFTIAHLLMPYKQLS
jgi:uncharacterized phage protein (predicted DNA packaging)